MAYSFVSVSGWVFLLFCFAVFAFALEKPPTRAIEQQPRMSPAVQEAAMNVKRALKQGLEVFRRDVCDDTFPDEGAMKNTCTPSVTVCCVRSGEIYPRCENFLNKGWCCVPGHDVDFDCFVDQPSACDEAGAVACSDLKPGMSEACCPAMTTCYSGYTTEENVRCGIASSALVSLASASAAASSSSSLGSSTALPTSTVASVLDSGSTTPSSASAAASTPAEASALPPPSSFSTSLSSGAIAGIAIGPTLALVVVVGLWFLYKRRQKKKQQQSYALPAMHQDVYPKPELASDPVNAGPYKHQHSVSAPPQELPVQYTYELDGEGYGRL